MWGSDTHSLSIDHRGHVIGSKILVSRFDMLSWLRLRYLAALLAKQVSVCSHRHLRCTASAIPVLFFDVIQSGIVFQMSIQALAAACG